MRNLLLLSAAAVGAGVFLSREPGRRWLRRNGESLREGYDTVRQRLGGKNRLDRWVEDTANRVHPDTNMAHAFEEAVHAR